MTVFFKFSGMSEAQEALEQLPARFEQRTIYLLSQRAYEEAQRGAARHSRTGALVQALFNRAIPKGREVGSDLQRAPHALFVHFGTKPHVILPSKKKALRWSAGGRFAFAKKVNHPGYRGDPFVHNAADAALRQFDAIVNNAFNEATR
jgi:hypothetical protein